MYKGKRILGLIPARGGSKGLPGKNIRPMLGKPLIAWTIGQALACKYLDKVIVSTDDEKIADTAKKYGADVPFFRPEELATDEARSVDVIFHALDFFKQQNYEFDYVVLLQPTSPLRTTNDIDRSIISLIENDDRADSLISVGELSHGHPHIVQKIDDKGFIQPFCDIKAVAARRQELSNAYLPYGVIFLAKTDSLRKYETFYQKRTLPFIIERWQHYEIDDIYDFMAAEMILKEKRGSGNEIIG
ncbi:MAG: cytidylyltransferase domain-containing protein [Bacillota bacterium]